MLKKVKDVFLPLSIMILSLSIVFASVHIGQSLKVSHQDLSQELLHEKLLLSEEEAAEYLGITVEEFKDILLKDKHDREGLMVYSTHQFIPYLEIGERKLFSKEELNEWVHFHMFYKFE